MLISIITGSTTVFSIKAYDCMCQCGSIKREWEDVLYLCLEILFLFLFRKALWVVFNAEKCFINQVWFHLIVVLDWGRLLQLPTAAAFSPVTYNASHSQLTLRSMCASPVLANLTDTVVLLGSTLFCLHRHRNNTENPSAIWDPWNDGTWSLDVVNRLKLVSQLVLA